MKPITSPTMQPLPSESFVFDPRPEFPLVSTVKRYAVPAAVFSTDPEALTLIVTHGTGFHKEQWEPTLQYLFDLLVHNAQAGDKLRVHEVWAIDCPNHGDAAVLNEDTLKWGVLRVLCVCMFYDVIHMNI